jgi:hypothetical protein
MDINDVPQDNSSTYANMKKALYVKDKEGKATSVASSGWEVEETVTKQALEDINEHIKEAYYEVKNGKKSTLYYHMYKQRMDLSLLSQATGFFKWRIKRDFEPKVFSKIKQSRLKEYCEVLGVSLKEIKELPNEQF